MNQRETAYLIDGPAGTLETVVRPGDAAGGLTHRPRCAVICHPHPLYGGTMDNKVITTLAACYAELGIAAVRWNFRGVGASAGVHDGGRGEVEDVLAVARWAAQLNPGAEILLAGFSFGAAIAAAASERLQPAHLLLVAPPLKRYAFAPGSRFPCPVGVVIGGEDDLVEAAEVQAWVAGLGSPASCVLIPAASHFFHAQLSNLSAAVMGLLRKALI